MGLYGEMRQEKMAVRTLLAVLLALLLLLAISPPKAAKAADVVVAATRVGGDNHRTRFVADISRAVSYTVYVLPDPYRVIIDIPGVTFNLPPDTGRKSRGQARCSSKNLLLSMRKAANPPASWLTSSP
jgi:N-acetylmuramoyl-L-alanine amidase